ncbi:MAG TPA: hypothetical protein VFY96_13845, partial [Candidatus Binatia bacterium]|nr:hypothetical protein [Candidatus Binatia bacterium]
MLYTQNSQSPTPHILSSGLLTLVLLFAGCRLMADYDDYVIADYGHLAVRSESQMNGFVLGVPHGTTDPDAVDYAKSVSDATGAGIVIAYGMKNKRITVAQPVIPNSAVSWNNASATRPGSIYSDFKNSLQSTTVGPIRFYVEFRTARAKLERPRIEVASAGFSFEQLQELKRFYNAIETRSLQNRGMAPVELVINPLDRISW